MFKYLALLTDNNKLCQRPRRRSSSSAWIIIIRKVTRSSADADKPARRV